MAGKVPFTGHNQNDVSYPGSPGLRPKASQYLYGF
jgi:hypothetical protein